jgi:hypothetical protein
MKQKNREFVWNSAVGKVYGGRKPSECKESESSKDPDILVFLWQDNNSVIGKTPGGLPNRPTHPTSAPARLTGAPLRPIMMSTVHSIHLVEDVIERFRRRPRVTSTNAKNVRDVFLYHPRLDLFIPLAINDYNHHMNGADVANQRRKHLTTQRKHTLRNWRSFWH